MAQIHSVDAQQSLDGVGDWENEGGHLRDPNQLERMGITRTLVESFSVGPHRYKKLANATAVARRIGVKPT